MVVGKNLLDDRSREGFQINACCFTSKKRFTPVFKDFAHHGVDTATSNEMKPSLFMVFVPHFLNLADDALINIHQTLKLINDEGDLCLARKNHQLLNERSHTIRLSVDVESQNIFHLLLKVHALKLLRFLTHKEI